MTRMVDKKNKEIMELKKILSTKVASTDLAEIIQQNTIISQTFKEMNDDAMSEFSKIDDEQDLREKENIVDLILGKADLNENSLT